MAAGAAEGAGVAVGGALALVQQQHLAVELVADAQRQLALPRDRLAQRVQLRVLLRQDPRVVRVDLRVAQPRPLDRLPVARRVVVVDG